MLEMLRKYWLINLCSLAGTFIGAQILFIVDPRILTTLLGVVVMIYLAISGTRFRVRISDQAAP